MSHATYEKLDDGTYTGEIASCPGVYSFGCNLSECQKQLRSVLEGWIFVGLKLGDKLPAIDSVDRLRMPDLEPICQLHNPEA
jgi:predicted RNase H-like HicB family nuclease